MTLQRTLLAQPSVVEFYFGLFVLKLLLETARLILQFKKENPGRNSESQLYALIIILTFYKKVSIILKVKEHTDKAVLPFTVNTYCKLHSPGQFLRSPARGSLGSVRCSPAPVHGGRAGGAGQHHLPGFEQ